MGQKYAEYDESGRITAYYDSEDSPPPEGGTYIAITYDEWVACITSQNHRVVDGKLVPPPPPTEDEISAELAYAARDQRNGLLRMTDWVITRHREQLEASMSTSLTDETYRAFLAYRQALRDIPAQAGFPHSVNWPVSP